MRKYIIKSPYEGQFTYETIPPLKSYQLRTNNQGQTFLAKSIFKTSPKVFFPIDWKHFLLDRKIYLNGVYYGKLPKDNFYVETFKTNVAIAIKYLRALLKRKTFK